MRLRSSLAASTLIIAAACGGDKSAPASNSPDGGTIIIASLGEARDVLPPFVNLEESRHVADLVFEHVAEIDSNLNTLDDKTFSPRLAEKWTWAKDSLSIAFSINPRARWHDGKPVTANDVRYSFNTFMDPKVASSTASVLGNVDSVSVRDSLTAVVFFKKRTPEQFYDFAYQVYVFPEHVYGKVANEKLKTDSVSRTLIGSGRFRVTRWEPGRMELVADTANYRGRAKVDRLILVKTDAPAAATQILSGEVDFTQAFQVEQLPALDTSKVARAVPLPLLGYAFMGMNQFLAKSSTAPHPIFSDVRMRRALSMAVDREGMLHNVFGASAKNIGRGPFSMAAAYADSTLTLPPYDTAKAGAMMDSSGWRRGSNGMRAKGGKPLHFTLTIGPSPTRRKFAVLLQSEFQKAGVAVDLEQLDFNGFMDKREKADFEAIVDGFSPDPSVAGVKQSWTTSGFPPAGENILRYSNRLVDALIDSATATFDFAKSKTYSSQALRHVVEDTPAIWLYNSAYSAGVNRRITMAAVRPDEWWANLADWSIDPSKRIDRDRIGLAAAKK